MNKLIAGVLPLLERAQAVVLNLFGAKSVGVRALVIDGDGRVLLVRHTYQSGWLTPGGGVRNGESPQEAIRRELMEEAGLTVTGPLSLFGVYKNAWRGRHDYPILFIVRDFEGTARVADTLEIAEIGWFAPDALPPGTTPKTIDRLNEFKAGRQLRESW